MQTLGGTSPIINVSAKVFITVGEDEFYVQRGRNQRLVPLQNHSFWDSPGIRTHNGDFRLATVINWTGNQFSYLDLQAVAKNFAHVDDVWNRSFLAGQKEYHGMYSYIISKILKFGQLSLFKLRQVR